MFLQTKPEGEDEGAREKEKDCLHWGRWLRSLEMRTDPEKGKEKARLCLFCLSSAGAGRRKPSLLLSYRPCFGVCGLGWGVVQRLGDPDSRLHLVTDEKLFWQKSFGMISCVFVHVCVCVFLCDFLIKAG